MSLSMVRVDDSAGSRHPHVPQRRSWTAVVSASVASAKTKSRQMNPIERCSNFPDRSAPTSCVAGWDPGLGISETWTNVSHQKNKKSIVIQYSHLVGHVTRHLPPLYYWLSATLSFLSRISNSVTLLPNGQKTALFCVPQACSWKLSQRIFCSGPYKELKVAVPSSLFLKAF